MRQKYHARKFHLTRTYAKPSHYLCYAALTVSKKEMDVI